jgi:hypothetical protein
MNLVKNTNRMLDRTLLPCGIAWCEKQEQIVQSLATIDTANCSMTFAMTLAHRIGESDYNDKILSQFGPEATPDRCIIHGVRTKTFYIYRHKKDSKSMINSEICLVYAIPGTKFTIVRPSTQLRTWWRRWRSFVVMILKPRPAMTNMALRHLLLLLW